ncbi:MAG: hypothetical protein ABWY45_01350 [Mycobacterium sp.]
MTARTEPKTDSRLAARLAALASLGAAVIHFAVAPAHWHEWMPAGVFFFAVAGVQLLWARVVLTRTTTPVLAAGIALNVGAVALWALSRTAGAPFGPHAGEAEVIQAADLCALLLQIYVVMGAGWVWYRGLRGEPVAALVSAVVLLGAVGVVALASTVGVASGLRHGHHGPAGGATDHHEFTVVPVERHHGNPPTPARPSPVVEPAGTPAPPALTEDSVPAAEPSHDAHGDHEH